VRRTAVKVEHMAQSALEQTSIEKRRTGLAVYAAFVAVSAYGGTLGLMTGVLDMGHKLNQRLPLHSPVLGGIALALLVGLPATTVALLAWRRDRRTDLASVVAGVLLVGWIVVEIAFIREISFLQIFYTGAGFVFIGIGRRKAAATTYRYSGASSRTGSA
jgi:hypothetical protein